MSEGLLFDIPVYIMVLLDKHRTLKEVIKIMAETNMTAREVLDQDYLSLSRIQRAINSTYESVLGEILRAPSEQQSQMFKDAISKIQITLREMEQLIFETQLGLDIPDSILDSKEPF
ncbi:hypothetical protein UFOVP1217_171 [uncultured Caudovirales phage]|uniref:Uncharacterized protein n=1 Tax=uncultured Caudovirales phage TaxID=2100421 RepID=A0A6J5MFW8_9CAUD|nr:hypothetical protein UFOVP465_61 [uncultured Caudovirales phage]CAB4156684.1 hypothetical protein UFOVP666_107 [uncultured Caudovirales phage]CAB4160437.1 hypothetical protein UFOVP727_184 [uncultured Caudovirales phage]CAB4164839.1 hypothetical protein UFOVP819_135 [uncultured Caudovirales phage]CAB4172296.1 hypothetical protein UFOVP926_139 [uncultured Caudovirales phage]